MLKIELVFICSFLGLSLERMRVTDVGVRGPFCFSRWLEHRCTHRCTQALANYWFAAVAFESGKKPENAGKYPALLTTIGDKKSPCLSLGRNCSSIELQRQMPVFYWHRRHRYNSRCTQWWAHRVLLVLFPSLRGDHSPTSDSTPQTCSTPDQPAQVYTRRTTKSPAQSED